MGCRFANSSASRGRSFCGSSNRLLCSLLGFSGLDVGQSEPVFFIFNQQNELCANEHKVAFLPTFILPVAEIVPPMCDRMVWLALFTEQRLDQPIIPAHFPNVFNQRAQGSNGSSAYHSASRRKLL